MSEQQNFNIRNFDLGTFKKVTKQMVATSTGSYSSYNRNRTTRIKEYTEKEVEDILTSGSLVEQQKLSRNFFYKDGFYQQIILYYSTLLKYCGLLIPNLEPGKKLESLKNKKRYYNAVNYIEKMNLPVFLTNCTQKVLTEGNYCGLIIQATKDVFCVLDLPSGYTCTRFKDINGNNIIEFDLNYFTMIIDKDDRAAAFSVYPSFIKKAWEKWRKGKGERWIKIPSELGICFTFFDERPPFLNIIPTIMKYDKSVDTEQKRDLEEIKKIIVQKIPHLTDGRLLFEPDEVEIMHEGAVGMMADNENTSVLTTYGDVDAIVSKTTSDAGNSTLDRMMQSVYSHAGVSSQIFASTGSSTLETSIKNDISLMMYLANKYAIFITNVVNSIYGNSSMKFKFQILPVGIQNEQKFIDTSFKLASSGYSFLVPAIASGISQRDLIDLKTLENDVLKLDEKLKPLSSSYTQTAQTAPKNNVGRPRKEQEEKNERTIENETSLDRQTEGGKTN